MHIMAEINKSNRTFGMWYQKSGEEKVGVFVCSKVIRLVEPHGFEIIHSCKGTAKEQIKQLADYLGMPELNASMLVNANDENKTRLHTYL